MTDGFVKTAGLRTVPISAFTARLFTFAKPRRLRLQHPVAATKAFITVVAVPLAFVVAQVQVQLLLRFTSGTTPVGPASFDASLLGAENPAPLIVPAAMVIASVGVRLLAVLFPPVGALVLPRLVVRPALMPGGVSDPAIPFSVLGTKARAPSIVLAAIAAAPVGLIAAPALLLIVRVEALTPGFVRIALVTGGRTDLFDHAVEPFAD